MGIKGVTPEFKIKPGQEKFKTANYWGMIRIKKDPIRKDTYIDVLMGKQHEKLKTHIGINLDQSIRFKKPRGVLKSIRREIDSKKRGRLLDETLPFNSKKETAQLMFKVIIDDKLKLIDLQFSEKPIQEK